MELILSRGNNPTNTNVLTTDGNVLYSTSTPFKPWSRVTTVSKHSVSGGAHRSTTAGVQELAKIHWHRLEPTWLEYNGQTIPDLDAFLSKTSIFSNSRSFVGSDRKSYKWKTSKAFSESCYLEDVQLGKTVVNVGAWSIFTGMQAGLKVDASVLHMLDLIVITLIYFEEQRPKGQSST
ncbi:hypothetical protein PsYK624_041710 [Phanerochaete sordida]|uniref:DUF6593 domain-containing protein n=1 Tax=Phanerochaete sordida TaxID=48140 RepID=A0A9P3G4F2_9APHY|nr:hypothetical protein PsYK624_041710 [Phanerochaete sordida]